MFIYLFPVLFVPFVVVFPVPLLQIPSKVLTSFTHISPPLNDDGAVIFIAETLPLLPRDIVRDIEVFVLTVVAVRLKSPVAFPTTLSATTSSNPEIMKIEPIMKKIEINNNISLALSLGIEIPLHRRVKKPPLL